MKYEKAFTTVEVLITLFIAAALLGAGYQVYGIVLKNGSDTQRRATASNLAYEALRKQSANMPSACKAATLALPDDIPSDLPLPEPRSLVVSVSCPYGDTNAAISRITATVTYGTDKDKGEVSHALFVKN